MTIDYSKTVLDATCGSRMMWFDKALAEKIKNRILKRENDEVDE